MTSQQAGPAPLAGLPGRYVAEFAPSRRPALSAGRRLDGRRVVVLGEQMPLADPLAGGLRALGADVLLRPGDCCLTPAEGALHAGVVLATGDGSGPSALPDAFAAVRAMLRRVSHALVFVVDVGTSTSPGGESTGWRGLVRCFALELPHLDIRLVELRRDASAESVATAHQVDAVLAVLGGGLAGDPRSPAAPELPLVVADTGERGTVRLHRRPLAGRPRRRTRGAVPGEVDAAALGLGPDSVVLLFGGARGITARIALKLAQVTGCRLELVGRTALPEGDDAPGTSGPGVREGAHTERVLHGEATAPRSAQQVRESLVHQEIHATLNVLRAHGCRVAYHAVDTCDAQAVRELVTRCFEEHGRIDGLVYGAGVLRDRLSVLTPARDFTQVYDTKVVGARAALEACAMLPDTPRFAVLFGSIAVLGNRGQSAYAAANDALEGVGRRWASTTGRRCLTVHWGPWAPAADHAGMVSVALSEEFARRGLSCIDPEEGAWALLRELAWGPDDCAAVYYAPAGWVDGA